MARRCRFGRAQEQAPVTQTKSKPMPAQAEFAPPLVSGIHTVAECDEILQRRAEEGRVGGETTDSWLDERLLAMKVEEK